MAQFTPGSSMTYVHPRVAKPPGTTPGQLAGIGKAANLVDVCERTVRRWIADGLITGYRVGPKLLKVDLAEIDALVRPVPTAALTTEANGGGTDG